MTAVILDGNAVFRQLKVELRERVAACIAVGVTPGLGTILIGDDPPSASYIDMKIKNCSELGIVSHHRHFPLDAGHTPDDVIATIEEYNGSPDVDAYLIQHYTPFPVAFDFDALMMRVDPDKEVDGLHPVNLGRLVAGTPGPRSCTPLGIQALLVHYGVPIEGQRVVIIGRGLTVGKPLVNLLSLKEPNANAAVTVVHTGVKDIRPFVEEADIVIAAAGSPGIVTRDMVKPGAAVVQSGVTRAADGTYLPDVADDVVEVAGWFAPVKGSVGPMTRAMLLTNCLVAAERRAGISP